MKGRLGTCLILLAMLSGASASKPASAAQSQADKCPTGYVLVPALKGFAAFDFCFAKYEMKNDGGVARSQAAGTPWINISRDGAMAACQALGPGYDLVSLDQWQSAARNIADTASNWSTGMAYVGELNTGNSDGTPGSALPGDLNDDNACAGTGETCSSTVWNSQRRTHTLSNGGGPYCQSMSRIAPGLALRPRQSKCPDKRWDYPPGPR